MGPTVLGGPSDADLVRAAQEGDADAVQETFLLALARLGQVRDPEAVGGWLHAVMRSVCAMELRRPARRDTVAELGGDVPVQSLGRPERRTRDVHGFLRDHL